MTLASPWLSQGLALRQISGGASGFEHRFGGMEFHVRRRVLASRDESLR